MKTSNLHQQQQQQQRQKQGPDLASSFSSLASASLPASLLASASSDPSRTGRIKNILENQFSTELQFKREEVDLATSNLIEAMTQLEILRMAYADFTMFQNSALRSTVPLEGRSVGGSEVLPADYPHIPPGAVALSTLFVFQTFPISLSFSSNNSKLTNFFFLSLSLSLSLFLFQSTN